MRKCLFIWFFILVCFINSLAAVDKNKEVLLQELAVSKQDTNRLNTLFQLIKITYLAPQEQLGYIDQLLKEAETQNNNFYKCQAYIQYMFQAYNKYDSDGVNKWMKLLEPLAQKEKLHDLLFRGKQCVIDMLLINEQYELEEREAKAMLKEARELKNINGQIIAYQSLAYGYLRTYREQEAFDILEQAMQLAPECNNQLLIGEVLRTMTAVCREIKDYPHWLKYLKMQDSLIDCFEKQFPNEPFQGDRLLVAISYLEYYIQLKDWNKAKYYLHLSKQNYSDEYIMVYKYNYFVGIAHYFIATKDWHEALKAVDEILKLIESTTEVEYANKLALKARLLAKTGNHKEALHFYKQAKLLKDSLSISTINKQAKQLKDSYKYDLQTLSEAEQQQQTQKMFLILSGIIILILVISIIHANQVKRKLSKAEKVMRAMMDETEQAYKIKERFLSNINKTIRPPLEIIVNYSAQLTSKEQLSQTEREQLSILVTQTSNHLMELINDILILSKLEAGMMKFTMKEIEIIQSVKSTLEAINQTQSEKVCIDTLDRMEYKINGDENYLKQVITSICSSPGTDNDVVHVQFEKKGETELNIKFINARLASDQISQNVIIRNEINRMIIEYFGGKYHIMTSPVPCIIITFTSI